MLRSLISIFALLVIIFVLAMAPSLWPKKLEQQGEVTQTLNGAQHITVKGEEDIIKVLSPKPGETIDLAMKGEFEVRGYARGPWYFEATFPIVVTNWDGLIIGEGYATADGEWMTTEYVPFTATIKYDQSALVDVYSKKGTLILQKSNASGDPVRDDAIEFDIVFP